MEEAFPSAPINEQQQIAKTLDSVLDAAIKYAELARALETVRREVLHELVLGERTLLQSYDRFLEDAS